MSGRLALIKIPAELAHRRKLLACNPASEAMASAAVNHTVRRQNDVAVK